MPWVCSFLASFLSLPRTGFNFGIITPTPSSNFTATQGTVSAWRSITFVFPPKQAQVLGGRCVDFLLAAASCLKYLQLTWC